MTLYSIGHSNAKIDAFINLLRQHAIQLVVDARSQPYSRFSPQFRREALKRSLQDDGIEYSFLGDQIGGRPQGTQFYFPDGKPDYDAMAQAESFSTGIDRLLELATNKRVAFMCSEADFKKCHRYNLITRTLVKRGIEVGHILHSGELVTSTREEFEPAQMSLAIGK